MCTLGELFDLNKVAHDSKTDFVTFTAESEHPSGVVIF